MAVTLDQVSEQILNNLKVLDPELDTSVGTPARKIIDSVAYAISQAYVDNHVISYTYDIDTKTAGDLDQFTQLFGIARLTEKRSTGKVTFTRSVGTTIVDIPFGTQVATAGGAVIFQTTGAVRMMVDQLSVEASVQCVLGGSVGNVGANEVTIIPSPISSGISVNNSAAITNGSDAESDSELRTRWKATVFRSLNGTEQNYLGLANSDPQVTSAIVLGSSKRRKEKVQVVDSEANSTLEGCKYAYPFNVFFGVDIDSAETNLLTQNVDYVWDRSDPEDLKVTNINSALVPNLEIADLSFEYVPISSRNDPENGIVNKVDIWVAGERAGYATQHVYFKNTKIFNDSSPGSTYFVEDWERLNGDLPDADNIFIPLSYGPITTLPNSIACNGKTYWERGASGTGAASSTNLLNAYNIIHLKTANGYSATSLFGIEWNASQTYPGNSDNFVLGSLNDYVFNEVPASIQANIDSWRLVGVDALVHQAVKWYLRFSFAIIYDQTQTIEDTDNNVETAIGKFLTTNGVGKTVQASDILQIVHNVSGVDAVRFIDASDIDGYSYGSRDTYNIGIQRIDPTDPTNVIETFITSSGATKSIFLPDNAYAVLGDYKPTKKSEYTFGAV